MTVCKTYKTSVDTQAKLSGVPHALVTPPRTAVWPMPFMLRLHVIKYAICIQTCLFAYA
jgi:hypothetical protein